MNERRWNWPIWAGFLLSLVAFLSYFLFLYRFPVTRDVPWVNYILFAAAIVLFAAGLKRAFGQPQVYRGKITAPILTVVGLVVVAFFGLFVFHFAKQLPAASGSPRVGAKAPDFQLSDTQGKTVSLASLLTTPIGSSQQPPKGVLLVFSRGYW